MESSYIGDLMLPNEDSRGNVYVVSQSSSVDFPNMPALGYCEAWIWVSESRQQSALLCDVFGCDLVN